MDNSNLERLPSFRQFNYRLRVNKSTERKMLTEAFRRLNLFEPVENYRYIGFGSTTFADFILFHKALNIHDMISIEKRGEYTARFEFNKPYDCVKIKYGDSNDVLPTLPWEKRSIIWLDYEDPLTDAILRDIALVTANAVSGSLLIITLNAFGYRAHDKDYKKAQKDFFKKLKRQIGREVLPDWIKGKNLEGDEMANTYRRIITDEILATLLNRNGIKQPDQKIIYRQLFNFIYKDNARMLTVGGILYEAREQGAFERCNFNKLNFVVEGDGQAFEINVPIMTQSERNFLNQTLPQGACDKALAIGLTDDEIANYVRLYRYCPSFAEVDI